MSDPIETAQQAQQHAPDLATLAGWLGMLTAFLGTVAGLWRVAFGSKAEKADALERAAEIALRNAEHADERAERADEESAVHKRERMTCEEQLAAMRVEIRARDQATAEAFRLMRQDLDALRAENANLRREQEIARGMLADLMRNASTPPPGRYTGDDVRAEMARLEETGP